MVFSAHSDTLKFMFAFSVKRGQSSSPLEGGGIGPALCGGLFSLLSRDRARGLAAALVLVAALGASAAQATVFYPESFTLDNGLQVVVVQNRLSPAVAQMVWYKVGSADEDKGRSGLAHYLEHLMFRGTATMEPGAFSKTIAAQGGSDNAFTSYDYTAYHEIIAADRLGMVMAMEADRMRNLRITAATATPELGVVLNERHQRTDNNPEGKFAEKLRQALFPDHPYGVPVIGWRRELERMTPEAATAFYQKHYAPNNAVVVISGNVDAAEVKRLAAETYGRVPSAAVAARPDFPPLSPPRRKRIVMRDDGVEQPQLLRSIVAPSYATQKNHEAYALEVLDEALSGGAVGLLYRELVMRQKIASGVGISYDNSARGPATFAISLTPQAGRALPDAERALDNYLRRLARTGLDAATVGAAKERLNRAAIFTRDSLLAPGYAFGMALTTGATVEAVENWPDHIAAVTVDEVNEALRQLLASPHAVTGLLLPDPRVPSQQKAKAQALGEAVR